MSDITDKQIFEFLKRNLKVELKIYKYGGRVDIGIINPTTNRLERIAHDECYGDDKRPENFNWRFD